MRTWLTPLSGGSPIELTCAMTLVGRQDHCDLKIDHKTVSKLHCVLVKADDAIVLRDLGSTNGCRINGQKKQKGALLANDVLTIAVFDFRVQMGDDLPHAAHVTGERTEMMEAVDLSVLDRLGTSSSEGRRR
jgi:pSer/pThr/pTyr-binding forkhead associated (FHA) protein